VKRLQSALALSGGSPTSRSTASCSASRICCGLVVDRYGDVLVAEIGTAAWSG